MGKYKYCSQEEYHDACRCVLEENFALASIPVVSAKTWQGTKKAMEKTQPLASLCVAIDAGFVETIQHLSKKASTSVC